MTAPPAVRFGGRYREDLDHHYSWTFWHGEVSIGGRVVAPSCGSWPNQLARAVKDVRRRTSDDWWRRADEIDRACDPPVALLGPVGDGVLFLLEQAASILPPEALFEIEADAYEAMREAVLDGAREAARDFLRRSTATEIRRRPSPRPSRERRRVR